MTTPARSTPTRPGRGTTGFVDALAQLTFAVQAVLTDVGADHDLSLTQVRLLGILRDRTVPMAEVARHLGLDKSSVSGLVGRAESRDLVRRTPSPDDGRGVLVGITPAGRRLARQAEREVRRRLLELTAVLTDAERSRLTAIIERVVGG